MDERRMVRISKYLAKHLRHQPERIGITLDEGGWVDVDVLLAAAARHGFPISEDELVQVVTANDKRRYTLENGRIRADQGHSVPVELGLPANDLERCWEIVQGGNMRLVDLPSANGKYFVQLGGIGLDAQAVKETTLAFKRSLGPLSYLISAAHIAGRQPPQLLIESQDAPVQEGSFVLVGNGRLYGGPFPFFKQAVIDDGLLDVVVFKRLGFLEIIKYLHDVVFSSDIRVPEIEYFQTRQLRVSSEQDVPVELDGELAGSCPVDFQMHEKALPVLSPPASP